MGPHFGGHDGAEQEIGRGAQGHDRRAIGSRKL
jgi:hypothetical protein